MREATIARNYAEALFQVGERAGETDRCVAVFDAFSEAIATEPKVRLVLESPRVSKETKQAIIGRALGTLAPQKFIGFLNAVIRRGRQGLLSAIHREYLALVDQKFNRIHAGVTLAREPDAGLREAVRTRLSEVVGMEVIAHFHTDRNILGGLIVRMGDRILDGSLRRKMVVLKQHLINA